MSHLLSRQVEGRRGGLIHPSGSEKQILPKISSYVSLARTSHMAAPSCKGGWEAVKRSLCLAQTNHNLGVRHCATLKTIGA